MESSKGGSRIEDYTPFFSELALRRLPPPFSKQNDAAAEQKQRNITPIFMDRGSPNDLQTPITEVTFTTCEGEQLRVSPDELGDVMGYGYLKGLPGLVQWVDGLYKRVHAPPTQDGLSLPSSLTVQICSGGREGVSKSCLALMDDNDNLLGEEAVYQTLVSSFHPRGIKGVPIRSDSEGMDAAHLRQVMSQWNEETQGRRPRVMYVIPTCSNPTGKTWSERRKQDIYVIAQEFNLLIIEDDPYYYLQYQRPLSKSLLSMDTDGRVIRLDSFSKTISPGCRVGLMFGPRQIMESIQQSIFPDTGGCSKLAQIFIYKVVEAWGYDKFLKHSEKLAEFYKSRAEKTMQLCDRYLKGLCEWEAPDGGMFLWLKITGVDNSVSIVEQLMSKGVFVVDGSVFTIDRTRTPFVRMCFSTTSDEELEKAMSAFADVLRDNLGK